MVGSFIYFFRVIDKKSGCRQNKVRTGNSGAHSLAMLIPIDREKNPVFRQVSIKDSSETL